MKKQTGFTLIELVIVIVILGILAATALPRFSDLTGDARGAKAKGVLGALKSAANVAHATQLARGQSANVTISVEGASVTMINGYPTADAAGILAATQLSTGSTGTDGVLIGAAGGTAAGDQITFQMSGAADVNECYVGYTAPASGNPPAYVVDTDKC